MNPLITKDEREIPLRSIGRRYVDQILQKNPIPEPPTYTVETAAGEKEVHPHRVIRDESGKITRSTFKTKEEEREWEKYEETLHQVTAERYTALTEFLVYQCVDMEPTPVSEWSIDPSLWGLEIPDPADKVKFKNFWVENELLPDPDDLSLLLSILYAEAGVIDKNRVREFERFFRATLARVTSREPRSTTASELADTGS